MQGFNNIGTKLFKMEKYNSLSTNQIEDAILSFYIDDELIAYVKGSDVKPELESFLDALAKQPRPVVVKCPTCGNECSPRAAMCPKCGESLLGDDIKKLDEQFTSWGQKQENKGCREKRDL